MRAQALVGKSFPGREIEHGGGRGHEPPKFVANLIGFSPRCTHHDYDAGVPRSREHSRNRW
jgi:hypothetical protein